ncbi:iron-containing alcohol dehydrogenase [candidate division KSB1 bacterium]|nr:iron-containing alcohol dehydrogenase [candidate division KSB1 bacterium]
MGLAVQFEFATASRIIFGAGRAEELGGLVAAFGRRAFLAAGLSAEILDPILQNLQKNGIDTLIFSVTGEPSVPMAENALVQARAHECDVVLAVGGGSAIDLAKVIAALSNDSSPLIDYLEVIGGGRQLTHPSLPFIAVPTTSGTGAEVTRNAVLTSPEHRVKVSLRSPYLLPRVALVDPVLTHSMPPQVTAATGLDALTQLIEPFLCKQPSPLVDALARDGIPRIAKALRPACHNGDDPEAREQMALAALYGGLALANAKLGAVHGIAAGFGGMFAAPHGAVCARLLPGVMQITLETMQKHLPDAPQIARMDEIARLLTRNNRARAFDAATWLEDLIDELAIPPLQEYGFSRGDFEKLIEKSIHSSSMKGHAVALGHKELSAVLERAMSG